MAAGQERQEPETFAQEVQEGKDLDTQDLLDDLSIEGLERINQLNSQLARIITEIYKPLSFPHFTQTITEMQKPAREMLDTVNSFADGSMEDINNITNSKKWKDLQEAAAHLSEALEQKRKEWEIIEPFLLKEIKKPEYGGKSIGELEFNSVDLDTGEIIEGSLWDKALTAAINAMQKQTEREKRQLLSVLAKKNIAAIKRTTDRVSNAAFDIYSLEQNGQMYFAEIYTGGKRESEPLSVYYCINYNSSSAEPIGYVAKHLLEVAYSTAQMQDGFAAWQDIFENLGNKGRISADKREEWKKIFLTMRHADVTIHNANEVNKSNYDYISEINVPFLMTIPLKGKRKGQDIEGIYIKPGYKPPLFEFAEQHGKEITKVPIGVYQVPGLQLTEDNARLHDYLISIVAAMKKNRISTRITYTKIFERIHIDGKSGRDRVARNRADKKITRIFDAFMKCNWIAGYERALSAKDEYCIDVSLCDAPGIEQAD